MNVAIVSGVPLVGVAEIGSAYYSRSLGEKLVGARIETEIWAKRIRHRAAAAQVYVREAWRPGWFSWWDILVLVFSRKPDVVHLQHAMFVLGPGAGGEFSTLLLLLCLRLRRQALVVTCHDVPTIAQITHDYVRLHKYTYPTFVVKAGLYALFWTIALCAQRVLVHQEVFKKTLVHDFRMPAGKVVVVPHLPVAFAVAPRPAARAAVGLMSDFPTVLFFGFATGYKGIEILLDAMDLLAERSHPARLILGAGEHPKVVDKPDYIAYYSALRKRAQAMPNVQFAGFLPDERRDDFVDASDVAIFPYVEFQGMSGPLNICASHGKPFLVSSEIAAAIPQLTAGVFEPAAPAIAQAVSRFFDDAGYRAAVQAECDALQQHVLSGAFLDITLRSYRDAIAETTR